MSSETGETDDLITEVFGSDDDDTILKMLNDTDKIKKNIEIVLKHIGKEGTDVDNIEFLYAIPIFLSTIQDELNKRKNLILLTVCLIGTSDSGNKEMTVKSGGVPRKDINPMLYYGMITALNYNLTLYAAYKVLLQDMSNFVETISKMIKPTEQAEEVFVGGQKKPLLKSLFSIVSRIIVMLMFIAIFTSLGSVNSEELVGKTTVVSVNNQGIVDIQSSDVVPLSNSQNFQLSNVERANQLAIKEGKYELVDANMIKKMPRTIKKQESDLMKRFPLFGSLRTCYEETLFSKNSTSADKYTSEIDYAKTCPTNASPFMAWQRAISTQLALDETNLKETEENHRKSDSTAMSTVSSNGVVVSFSTIDVEVPSAIHMGTCRSKAVAQEERQLIEAMSETMNTARIRALGAIGRMKGNEIKQKFTSFLTAVNQPSWPSEKTVVRPTIIMGTAYVHNDNDWKKTVISMSRLTQRKLATFSNFDFDIFEQRIQNITSELPSPVIHAVPIEGEQINTNGERIYCYGNKIHITTTVTDIPLVKSYTSFLEDFVGDINLDVKPNFEINPEVRSELLTFITDAENLIFVLKYSQTELKNLLTFDELSFNGIQDTMAQIFQLYIGLKNIAENPDVLIKKAAEERKKIKSATMATLSETNKDQEEDFLLTKNALETNRKHKLLPALDKLETSKEQAKIDDEQRSVDIKSAVAKSNVTYCIEYAKEWLKQNGWNTLIITAIAVGFGVSVVTIIFAGPAAGSGSVTFNKGVIKYIFGLANKKINRLNSALDADNVEIAQPAANPAAAVPGNLRIQDDNAAADEQAAVGDGRLALAGIVDPNQGQGLGDLHLEGINMGAMQQNVQANANINPNAVAEVNNALGQQLGQQNQNPFGGKRSRQTKKLMRYRKTRRTGNKTRKNKKQRKQTKKRRRQNKNKKNTKRN